MSAPAAVVFVDFDGTITTRDATDSILEAFADRAWLEIEAAWLDGRIGSRECLTSQIALVAARQAQMDDLLDGIDVDAGFEYLLDVCAAERMPVHIVSDGFDYCIERILSRPNQNFRARLTGDIVSSSLCVTGVRWQAQFPHPLAPCPHGCATCKPAVMTRLNPDHSLMVFIGDGLSDRHAAQYADLVFAKDKLATFCEQAAIPYLPFSTLSTVALKLTRLLDSGRLVPPGPRKVSSAP